MKKRGFLGFGEIAIWVIALLVLTIVAIGLLLLSDRAGNALDFIKGILRFGA